VTGAELRAYRRARGLTQAEMADWLRISRTWYQTWESPRYNGPPANVEERLGLLPARYPRTKQLPLFTTRPGSLHNSS
jgi:transcriptional regulator with XRE-family HTH domain